MRIETIATIRHRQFTTTFRCAIADLLVHTAYWSRPTEIQGNFDGFVWQEKHGIKLKYPDLPLVVVHPKRAGIEIPMELVTMLLLVAH